MSGTIVFVSERDGDPEIYSIRPDGTGLARLTDSAASDFAPSWSPSAPRIAFISDRGGVPEIYVMNADSSGEARLSAGGPAAALAWSPDGVQIAFTSDFVLSLINADGSRRTDIALGATGLPAWSPDSSRIAFVGHRSGPSGRLENIFLTVVAGSRSFTNLTNSRGRNVDPAWSPDGNRIAFSSSRDGNYEIYVMNRDGSNQIRLTNDPRDDFSPAWSPDGTRIAFTNLFSPET